MCPQTTHRPAPAPPSRNEVSCPVRPCSGPLMIYSPAPPPSFCPREPDPARGLPPELLGWPLAARVPVHSCVALQHRGRLGPRPGWLLGPHAHPAAQGPRSQAQLPQKGAHGPSLQVLGGPHRGDAGTWPRSWRCSPTFRLGLGKAVSWACSGGWDPQEELGGGPQGGGGSSPWRGQGGTGVGTISEGWIFSKCSWSTCGMPSRSWAPVPASRNLPPGGRCTFSKPQAEDAGKEASGDLAVRGACGSDVMCEPRP